MPFRNFMRIFVGLCFLKSPYSVFIRALKLHVGLLTDLTPEATSGVLQHHAKNGSILSSLMWSSVNLVPVLMMWLRAWDRPRPSKGRCCASMIKLCQGGSLPIYNYQSVPALSPLRKTGCQCCHNAWYFSDADKCPQREEDESHELYLTCASCENAHVRINK